LSTLLSPMHNGVIVALALNLRYRPRPNCWDYHCENEAGLKKLGILEKTGFMFFLKVLMVFRPPTYHSPIHIAFCKL